MTDDDNAYLEITVSGPLDVPDVWKPEETLPNGTTVPGRMVDMSGWFALCAETRHGDHVHGYTMNGIRKTFEGWPELMDKAKESIRDAVRYAVEDCENGVEP